MLIQNRLKIMALKNDFSLMNIKYNEALKYYGYNDFSTLLSNKNPIITPFPLLKYSRTLSKQASLPRLPVPSLDSSINKYLTAVRPLINETEFENTKKIVKEFIKKDGLGEKLQKLLVERSKSTDNWLAQWWLDKIYLEPRYNVVINVNPGSLYPRANYKTMDDQLKFATKYVCGFLEFKKYLEDQKLPADKLGDAYLCMDQYYKLFGTCRIPNKDKDDIKLMQVYNTNLEKSNHITIMYKNRIFSLQIINPETGINYSPFEIYEGLKNIVDKSSYEYGMGLGVLTAENRDIWYDVYSKLSKKLITKKKDEVNAKNFEQIHDSFFVLCLDDKEIPSDQVDQKSLAAAQVLHGNKAFTANRWFDKTIQVIIGANGVWGVNFEHSIAEALPHALMNDYIYNYINSDEQIVMEKDHNYNDRNKVKELEFKVSNDIKNQIQLSNDSLNKFIDNLELYILKFDAFGKNFPKSQKISPDAFVQIAMQLAFYRAHNKLGNAYESGSLRKYYLGRTDIIRTCSADAAEFVKTMANGSLNSNYPECAKLLLKAINSHRLFTNQVINCESFDRHLLGLKLISIENNLDMPEIYKDVSFQKLCHYYISSSQVSSKTDAVTCYGPAVEDGYGACYNILEKKLYFGLSSYKSCKSTSAKMFGEYIQNALIDCQNLLLKVNPKL